MSEQPVVGVTGAGGYVGSVIVDSLEDEAHVVGLVRRPDTAASIKWSFASDMEETASALGRHGVTHLIHAAWDMSANSLADLDASCVQGSQRLLHAARIAGLENLIFISSISAFEGARSAYGRSKLKVERMFLSAGGTVLRLGLVFGVGDRGLFGNLRATVRRTRFVPVIGRGNAVQYLLHESTLGEVIRSAVGGTFDHERVPITVAHPSPVRFRDLLTDIAAAEGRSISLVPVPWQLLYGGLRAAESLGLKLQFRSDSVLSFVHQDRHPDFRPMLRHGIKPVPFRGVAAAQ